MTILVTCYIKEKKNNLKKIVVEGHSEQEKKGKDLVCAAVSAITNGTANFILNNYPEESEVTYFEEKLELTNKKKETKNTHYLLCLQLMIFQLQNIAAHFPKNIKIHYVKW